MIWSRRWFTVRVDAITRKNGKRGIELDEYKNNKRSRKRFRGRRSADNDTRLDGLEKLVRSALLEKGEMADTINRLELRVEELETNLQYANEEVEDMKLETIQLIENEARLNFTIAELESTIQEVSGASPTLKPTQSRPAGADWSDDDDYDYDGQFEEADTKTQALVRTESIK